jgi:hypothetical protein
MRVEYSLSMQVKFGLVENHRMAITGREALNKKTFV